MSKKITVYSKPACSGCIMTKNWLEGNGNEFQEIDIFESIKDEKYVTETLGFQQLPVIVIEGVEPFSGFNPNLLQKNLGKGAK